MIFLSAFNINTCSKKLFTIPLRSFELGIKLVSANI
jgi:hypothetical protein